MQVAETLQFRSPSRDLDSDLKRLRKVRRALREAIDEATEDAAGLQKRLAIASERANLLMGDEAYPHREAESDRLLRVAEVQLVRASDRLHQLTKQIEKLREVENIIGAHEDERHDLWVVFRDATCSRWRWLRKAVRLGRK